jgi:hypothetical protein
MLYRLSRGLINPNEDQYIIGTPRNPPFLTIKILEGIEYYIHKGQPIITKSERVKKPSTQRFYYALTWNLVTKKSEVFLLSEKELVDAIINFMKNDYFGQSPSHFRFENLENKHKLKQYLKEKGKNFIM